MTPTRGRATSRRQEIPSHPHEPSVQAMGRTMATDLVTAEVVTAFRKEGIRGIVLKGPALARWLYDEGALRPYLDADILVSPVDFPAAEGILGSLGFEREGVDAIPGDWPKHARTWSRTDGGNVDLHRTLFGVGIPDAELWEVLSVRTEPMRVAGADVEVLDLPGRAVVLTLHAAKDGTRVGKVRHDLGHAVDRVGPDVWREAGALAARLDALGTFAAGLRILPAGEEIARRLQLPDEVPVEAALRRRGGPPPFAAGMEWLAAAPGVRGKTAVVVRKVFPPPAFMRAWSSLARRGPLGLAAAYVARPFWVLWRLVPALRAWRRARREAGRSRAAGDR
jgi:Uncharacterised nucleotidyltransferase